MFKISSTINLVNCLYKTLPKSPSASGFTLTERDLECQLMPNKWIHDFLPNVGSRKPDLWEKLNDYICIQVWSKKKQTKEQGGSFEAVRNITRSRFQITVTEFKENVLLLMPQRNHLSLKFLSNDGFLSFDEDEVMGHEVACRKAQMTGTKLSTNPAPCSHFFFCLAQRLVRHFREESRRQLEELRLIRKHKMRKRNNWKPLWWRQEQSQR